MDDDLSVLDRIVRVTQVGWFRTPTGSYIVTWTEDNKRQVRSFRTAGAAAEFAAWLDVSGDQVTVREVRDAERALKDLERTIQSMERMEEREALRPLQELKPLVRRGIPIVRHLRRSRRGR